MFHRQNQTKHFLKYFHLWSYLRSSFGTQGHFLSPSSKLWNSPWARDQSRSEMDRIPLISLPHHMGLCLVCNFTEFALRCLLGQLPLRIIPPRNYPVAFRSPNLELNYSLLKSFSSFLENQGRWGQNRVGSLPASYLALVLEVNLGQQL